jgi:hypothetical protein
MFVRFQGIEVGDSEYACAMLEAKIEFDAWERDKRKGRKANKTKFKAQRLAKLDAQKAGAFVEDDE